MAPPPPGFDASNVSPPDAVVTLRSLRRRFAEAFQQADPPDLVTTAGTDGLSPVDRASWVADALQEMGTALRQVEVSDDPAVTLPPPNPPAPSGSTDADAVLARLAQTAAALADQMSEVHGDDWARPGRTVDGTVTAADIVRAAVAIGIDQLRAVQAALGAGRR